MQPLGTKVYLLKRYSPSDSFCTFFLRVYQTILITTSGESPDSSSPLALEEQTVSVSKDTRQMLKQREHVCILHIQ